MPDRTRPVTLPLAIPLDPVPDVEEAVARFVDERGCCCSTARDAAIRADGTRS